MMATAIPRIQFSSKPEELDIRTKLATDAKEKLGYNKLANAIAIPGALMFNLRKLGIEPLVTDKVGQYQSSKEKTGMWSGTRQFIISVASLFICFSCFVGGMVGGGPTSGSIEWSPFHYAFNALIFACGMVCLIRTFFLGVIAERIGGGKRKVTKWYCSSLSAYRGNVPDFALSRALEVKSAVPGVKFEVEWLGTQIDERVDPKRDPFLVAVLDNERYYLDVWDEKEYERTI